MRPLTFHIRENTKNPHTICTDTNDVGDTIYVGYSVTHKRDNFNRKRGRQIAAGRLTSLMKKNKNYITDPEVPLKIHDSVVSSINEVVKRTATIRNIKGVVTVKVWAAEDTADVRNVFDFIEEI